jgi:hypothetical protein
MRKDHFTEEALAQAKVLSALKYSENPEDQLSFAEAYDFARCQRPDGSFYPIPEGKQCRKGNKATSAELRVKPSQSKGKPTSAQNLEQTSSKLLEKAKSLSDRLASTDRVLRGLSKSKKNDAQRKQLREREEKLVRSLNKLKKTREALNERANSQKRGGLKAKVSRAIDRILEKLSNLGLAGGSDNYLTRSQFLMGPDRKI